MRMLRGRSDSWTGTRLSNLPLTLARTSRRGFLATLLLLTVAPAAARAMGPASLLRIGLLRYPSAGWNPRPGALRTVIRHVGSSTSIEIAEQPLEVEPTIALLRKTPLVVWGGDRGFAPLAPEARSALAAWMRAGGLLLIDSSEGRTDAGFDSSVRRELAAILPDAPLSRIGADHVLYKTFYLIRDGIGRMVIFDYLEGATMDGRLAAIYCRNDMQGSWAVDSLGQPQFETTPGGLSQREMTERFGVNVVLYATCTDYKADQAHVKALLRRREWRVDE